MVGTKTYQIKPGGGGHFTSIDACEANRNNLLGSGPNLVANNENVVLEIYGGGSAVAAPGVTFHGGYWTTDSTHYIEIRAAAGEGHNGTWDSNKAKLELPSSLLLTFYYNNIYGRVTGLQFRNNSSINTFTSNSANTIIDKCIFYAIAIGSSGSVGAVAGNQTYKNCIILVNGTSTYGFGIYTYGGAKLNLYNNTICVKNNGGTYNAAIYAAHGGTVVTCQNNYLSGKLCYIPDAGSVVTKGTNDITSNAEAATLNFRNVPYTASTFLSVVEGSENLRPVVLATNKLLDNGVNLTSEDVTTDIIGTARPKFGAFDIGAFENDIPICWNYTAQYKNSNKLYKTSGCGSFPRNLNIPNNVDKSTGKMVDDGDLIDPRKYEVR